MPEVAGLVSGWLDEHPTATREEREAVFRMQQLAAAGGEAFDRGHFSPGHFTASAFVLSPDRASLLLIHHRKLDLWLQPGGHFEPGETDPVAAARRELLEECGLDGLSLVEPGTSPLFDVDVHPIPARPGEPAHEHFDLRFLFVATHPRLDAGEEVHAARWVPLAEVGGLHGDESVLRAVRKVLAEGEARA